jgi:hypothetical protein
MTTRIANLLVALTMLSATGATALPPERPVATGPAPIRVQQEIPDVVRLLAQRARRAERRGDMATAAALYDAIRELGYVVRRRESTRPNSGARDDDGGNGGIGNRAGDRGGGGRDDDDDDDDGDDDGGDDGDDDDDDD